MNQDQAPVADYDTVDWNITGGYFGTSSSRSQTYSNANLIFTNVVQNNGWGEAVTRFSSATTVTGEGPFSLTTAGIGQDYVFAGNMQGYSGDVNIAAFGNTTLTPGNTGSSVVQYGGETAGGNVALGSITNDSSGDWINNIAGTGSMNLNNVVFNYGTDSSYDYVRITNNIEQRFSVNFIGNADVTASGEISGIGILRKSGTGTLTLTAQNTYSGSTTINGGILQIGNGGTSGTLGTGAVSVASGAELIFNRSNAFTVGNTLSGDGLMTKKGAGRMTVNGNNSGGALNWNFTGTGNGDIGFQNANAIGGSGSTITLADNATGSAFFSSSGNNSTVAISIGSDANFTWNGSTGNTNTLSGKISGSGTFTKVSGENLILTGANSFSGAISISGGGRLEIGGSGVLGSGSHAGNISNANTLFINTTSNQTLSGTISGGGGLNKSNTGTLVLEGSNTFTGNININGGVLELSPAGKLYNGGFNNSAVITVNNGGTWRMPDYSYSGMGQLADYRQRRILNGGTIEVTGDSHSSGQDFTVTGEGGTFRYTPSGQALTLSGNTNTNILLDGPLTFDAIGDISVTDNAIIEGDGVLTKTGSGTLTLTLSTANTYTGATAVNAGTLVVNGSITSDTTVASGARLGGTGTITGALTVNGTHAPGNSPGIQEIVGNTTYGATSVFEWDLAANAIGTRGTDYDGVNIEGSLTVVSGAEFRVVENSGVDFADTFWTQHRQWSDIFDVTGSVTGWAANTAVAVYDMSNNLLDVSSYGSFSITDTTLNWQAIPEPSTALAGLLLGMGMFHRRRAASRPSHLALS